MCIGAQFFVIVFLRVKVLAEDVEAWTYFGISVWLHPSDYISRPFIARYLDSEVHNQVDTTANLYCQITGIVTRGGVRESQKLTRAFLANLSSPRLRTMRRNYPIVPTSTTLRHSSTLEHSSYQWTSPASHSAHCFVHPESASYGWSFWRRCPIRALQIWRGQSTRLIPARAMDIGRRVDWESPPIPPWSERMNPMHARWHRWEADRRPRIKGNDISVAESMTWTEA